MKPGTKIEVRGIGLDGKDFWTPAWILKQPKGGYPVEGYFAVQYDDGGQLSVHESRFRVVDNAARGKGHAS